MALAASAADVRSILAIPTASASSGNTSSKRAAPPAKKPEGISRELYALIGPSAPSLSAQLHKPLLKQKPNLGGASSVKWEWHQFSNPARTDSLKLYHWVKSSEADAEYHFAKYNVGPPISRYTDEEYTRVEAELAKSKEEHGWSREETDYLFGLCEDYDLRWYIIFDRYSFSGGKPRTIEDLKDRYFSICRQLVLLRPFSGDDSSKNSLLNSLTFDKEKEEQRKKYIATLDSRSKEQLAEEDALFIEIKRLEQNERNFKRERDNLLRVIAGIDSGLPDIVEDEMTVPPLSDPKKKKRGFDDSPSTPSLPVTPVKRPQAKNPVYDAQHCIIRTDSPSSMPATKAAHQPAYLRSFKLPVPKAAISLKITQALQELGINHNRLVMPTRDNVALLESLLDATVALLETKKMADKLDYDISVAKQRLGIATDNPPQEEENPPVDNAMDVDEEVRETVGEDDRAQSVVSVSTRGRKHAARSMSISSVDTTATVSTRAGTKRQKRN